MTNIFQISANASAEQFDLDTRIKLQNHLVKNPKLREALQTVYNWEPRHCLQNISVVVFPKYLNHKKGINKSPLSSVEKNVTDQYNLITELLNNENFSELFEKLIEYAKTNPDLADYFLKELLTKDAKREIADDGR